jgi:hypothetical protein
MQFCKLIDLEKINNSEYGHFFVKNEEYRVAAA